MLSQSKFYALFIHYTFVQRDTGRVLAAAVKNRGVGRGGGGARRTKETKKKEEEKVEERKLGKERRNSLEFLKSLKRYPRNQDTFHCLSSIIVAKRNRNKERTEERREKKKRIRERDTHKHTRTYTEKTEKFVDVRCVFSLQCRCLVVCSTLAEVE